MNEQVNDRGAEMSKVAGLTHAPLPRIKWHESWIIRLAAIASFILFVGYVSSAYVAFQSIDSISELAYDEDIEHSLAQHLDDIKRIHSLQQQLIVERLWRFVGPFVESKGTENGGLSEERLRSWLTQADLGELTNVAQVQIEFDHQAIAAADRDTPLTWLDRDRLRVFNAVLTFPKGSVYEAFKAAEDVRQRYQLVGAKLEENIRPTLIRAMSVILVISFFLLVSIVVFYARIFKRRVGEVIEGFSIWSESDNMFRFDNHERFRRYGGELKLITSQFNSMADEVEANRQRSLFLEKIASWQIIARKLAHEIKNPLTPIQMMVSQLKRRYKGDDEDFGKLLDHAQTIITEEVAGLRRMVDNFSNFARLPEPAPKPGDLAQLCRNVVELQKNAFQQHNITFDLKANTTTAVIDEDLLRQVLINLIKNAGEACGDKPANITVGLSEAAGEFLVTVQDDGPGIPPEHLERIFEAYFTTKHTGPSPGMGLGLAVCQKIVMDHGGKMSVKSRPGETIFTIRLPKRTKSS